MQHKREARRSYHTQRATDLLIEAHDNTLLMDVLHSVYRSCIICSIPLLALVVLGPMFATGVLA